MKKLMNLFVIVGIVFSLLVACTQEESSTEATDDTTDETVTEENDSDDMEVDANEGNLNAEEILLQSTEAMNQINSYSMEMEMKTTMRENGQENTMESFITGDVLLDPLSFSQTMTDASGNEQSQQYMDEDGTTYIFDPLAGQWIKIENSETEITMEVNPQEQLEMILSISDEIIVEEEDNQYILTVEGSGDGLLDITKELTQMEGEIPEEFLEEMNINTFNFVTYINKDTFLQERMDMAIEMELTMEIGEETQTFIHLQETKTTFTGFDEIEEISIPQEAIDDAVEVNLDDMLQETEDLEGELEQQSDELDELLEELEENLDQ